MINDGCDHQRSQISSFKKQQWLLTSGGHCSTISIKQFLSNVLIQNTRKDFNSIICCWLIFLLKICNLKIFLILSSMMHLRLSVHHRWASWSKKPQPKVIWRGWLWSWEGRIPVLCLLTVTVSKPSSPFTLITSIFCFLEFSLTQYQWPLGLFFLCKCFYFEILKTAAKAVA